MEIVKFKDGRFGIRKGNRYLDLYTPIYWWALGSLCRENCKGTEKKCRELLDSFQHRLAFHFNNRGEVVKLNKEVKG